MINPKQRAFLKKMAHEMKPTIQVGKGGITEHVIRQIDEMLEAHELIKGRVLDTSPAGVREVTQELIDATGADFVQTIGLTFVLYRPAKTPAIRLPR